MYLLSVPSVSSHYFNKIKQTSYLGKLPALSLEILWNSFLKEYRSYAPDLIRILETRSEVKVTVTGKWNGTIHHSKIHSHTKFGIPTSNNKRDTFLTQIFYKLGQRSCQIDPKMVCEIPQSKVASTHQIWDSYLQ